MYDKLYGILKKYNIDYIIDTHKTALENCQSAIEFCKINNICMNQYYKIMQLIHDIDIDEKFFRDRDGMCVIQEFLDNGYILEDNKIIIRKGYIPIEFINYSNNRLAIVPPELLKREGYGITEIHIYLGSKIHDIYCVGNHPNVNNDGNSFCCDSKITELSVTYDNIENFVKPLLSSVNLNFSYSGIQEHNKIEELVNGYRN
jgi:hypothetical protein